MSIPQYRAGDKKPAPRHSNCHQNGSLPSGKQERSNLCDEILSGRGILHAAREAGWEYGERNGQPGWNIPLADGTGKQIYLPDGRPAVRWKNYDSNATPKCTWGYGDGTVSKPDGCELYFVPGVDIRAAIAKNKHAVLFVCGEPDKLTLMAAGIDNVVTAFGEKCLPPDLAEQLRQLDPELKSVYYIPDRDKTGHEAVDLLAGRLHRPGIVLHILELTEEVNGHSVKDVNDLFRALGCEPREFREQLRKLDRHIFRDDDPSSKDAAENREVVEAQGESRDQGNQAWQNVPGDQSPLPDAFIAAIESRLGVNKFDSTGWSNLLACPFENHEHDDRSPAAAWNHDMKLLRCFKCGTTSLAVEVGRALGIELSDYREKRHKGKYAKRKLTTQDPTSSGEDDTASPTPTDDEMGDALRRRWDGNVAYIDKAWYSYHSGVWSPEETVPEQIWDELRANKPLKVRPTKGRRNSVECYLQDILRVPSANVDQGDQYINFRNGLFNLETYTLEEHRRELFQRNQLPIAYHPSAKPTVWLENLERWFIDGDGRTDWQLILLLQEAFGYSLTCDTNMQTGFWLNGPSGSGKSTVLRTLALLAGSSHASLDLNSLERNGYQLADLVGKRVVTCTESRAGVYLLDDVLKQLISGESLVARQIYLRNTTYEPKVKVWWAMNELPKNRDRSNAIYRRLRILPMLNALPVEQQDRQLLNKLRQELPGIFNWAMEGLQRLRSNGDFTRAEQSDRVVDEYRNTNDKERAFVAECCIQCDGERVQAAHLYQAYVAWCKQNGHQPKTPTAVAQDWKRLGLDKTKDGCTFYTGLKLKPEALAAIERPADATA